LPKRCAVSLPLHTSASRSSLLFSLNLAKRISHVQKYEIRKAQQQLRRLEKKLAWIGPVMRGSIIRIGTRNKQFYFSLNKDKKTRLIYLGNQREPLARKLSDNYNRLWAIVEEMTVLNMELLKNNAMK
jgi:hypothetical protein